MFLFHTNKYFAAATKHPWSSFLFLVCANYRFHSRPSSRSVQLLDIIEVSWSHANTNSSVVWFACGCSKVTCEGSVNVTVTPSVTCFFEAFSLKTVGVQRSEHILHYCESCTRLDSLIQPLFAECQVSEPLPKHRALQTSFSFKCVQ